MIYFNELYQQYKFIDDLLATQERAAIQGGQSNIALRISLNRQRNDQAYFVLLIAQFENHVTEKCLAIMRHKQNLSNWEVRRLWDTFSERRIKSLQFKDKLSLVVDSKRQEVIYDKMVNYYRIRNLIAHGKLLDSQLLIANISIEIKNCFNLIQ